MRQRADAARLMSGLRMLARENAVASVEWAILAALIAAAVIFVILQVGLEVQSMFELVRSCVTKPSSCP